MGYLFLIGCIVFAAVMIMRARRSGQASAPNNPPTPRRLTINFEKVESLVFWIFIPLVFGVVFFTCVFTPIKGCQDKLSLESEKSLQRMHARQMESSRRYQEYQQRAYPQKKKEAKQQKPRQSHRQSTTRNPFLDLPAVEPPPSS